MRPVRVKPRPVAWLMDVYRVVKARVQPVTETGNDDQNPSDFAVDARG